MQGDTALGLRVFELVEASEVAVSQDRISQGPQVLSRLQFRRVRRKEEQMDMFRDPQAEHWYASPHGPGQGRCACGTGAHQLGESRQFHRKQGNADRRSQMKDGAT